MHFTNSVILCVLGASVVQILYASEIGAIASVSPAFARFGVCGLIGSSAR
jgi:hypothetical protein